MTEQEWAESMNPTPMLEYLRGKASDRKLRHFACACCRLVWHRLPDACHLLVQAVEDYADKQKSLNDLVAMFDGYSPHRVALSTVTGGNQAAVAVRQLCWHWRSPTPFDNDVISWMVYQVARSVAESLAKLMTWQEARQREGQLLRDLFGYLPFRPISFDPAWLTWHDGLLVSMARQMYESRDFTDMPILADALEEAGCTNADILAHCRRPGEHVRGCWVVDALLGKS